MENSLIDSAQLMLHYLQWLDSQRFSAQTKRVYTSRVRQFIRFLDRYERSSATLLVNKEACHQLVCDFQAWMSNTSWAKPRSVNGYLTAISGFFESLGLAAPPVQRQVVSDFRPRRILAVDERQRLMSQLATSNVSTKHKALILLMLHTGMRISDCAALDMDDLVSEGNYLKISMVSRGYNRVISLDRSTEAAVRLWVDQRNNHPRGTDSKALFINRDGRRITCGGIDTIVRSVGARARVELSAKMLRDTYWNDVFQSDRDPRIVIAELAGYGTGSEIQQCIQLLSKPVPQNFSAPH